ncbi:MAG: 2Fe-2S iron-sulfur cluster binding domain-containing protein [Pseudomonadales bacterium]|nr:2Fe-2S iron-sulfur cluster binding domain-containing protein [Pseudomonadales bacterium]
MSKITFVKHTGEKSTFDAENGISVMNVAVDNLVTGIDADCGGECNCATCHIYVDEKWWDKVGGTNPTEEAIMSLNPDRQATSRLSCQIKVSDELDGLEVHLPEFQY